MTIGAFGLFGVASLSAQTGTVTGYCTQGAQNALTSGLPSSNALQGIVPSCTVTVYLSGTTAKATLFADAIGTPLANPFTATTLGQWLFWSTISQSYDVTLSGGTYAPPVTITGLTPGLNSSLLPYLLSNTNIVSGYSIVGDSTWVMDASHGADDYTKTSGYKVAAALNMPVAQDVAIAGAGAADCFPVEITPNALNPGPGYQTIPDGQGWSILSLGINNFGAGTSANATGTYTEEMKACAEWLGIPRKYKVMATDPTVTLGGGFASNSTLINGGAIATTNGAVASFPITTYGNQLHILYGIYVQGAVISANYVSGGSVTGVAGQGCFVGSFNNGSTASATVKLTGTNTLAGAAITFNLTGGTGATAAPTTAVITSGSATCSGTINISSLLGLGGATGAPLPTATVTIDGVTPSTGGTLLGQGVGGFNFSSIINLTTGVPTVSTIADASYPVSAGAHAVIITTQNTGPFTIGGVLSQGPIGINPAAVAIGGVLHQNACASDIGSAAYDALNQSLSVALINDGIIAPFIADRAAVGCGTDGTVANSGMSGNPTNMPDGTTCPASTSPGSHPNDCGYENRTQAYRQGMIMFTQAVPGSTYNVLQADSHNQPIQTSLTLPQWMLLHNLSFVNSGAWPILSGYNHTAFNGAAGIYPWHIYFDSNSLIYNFAISPQVAAVTSGVVQAGKEASLTNLFQIKINNTNPGLQTFFPQGNGAPTEYRFPGIQSQEFFQPQMDNHPGYAASLAFNMGYSLSTTALTGDVSTMTLNMPYVTSLGGQAGTIGFCNGAAPHTVAAPSNFDVTHPGYDWPFANTANFDTTTNLCNEMDIAYNQAQASWQRKPWANLHFANIFTAQQTMPTLKMTGSGCGSATAYPASDGSGCSVPTGTGGISLTTTGTSGPATLVGTVLNVPQYTGGGGSGIANVNVSVASFAIPGNTCYGSAGSTTPATFSMPGLLTSSKVSAGFTGNPSAINGWGATGGLTVEVWPSGANTGSLLVCNQTGSPNTGGAITFVMGAQ